MTDADYVHDGPVTASARFQPPDGPSVPAAVAVYLGDLSTGRDLLAPLSPAAARAFAVQLHTAADVADTANDTLAAVDMVQVTAYLALSLPQRAPNTDPALGDAIRRVEVRRAAQDRRSSDRRHVA